jgi:hypothetical protein
VFGVTASCIRIKFSTRAQIRLARHFDVKDASPTRGGQPHNGRSAEPGDDRPVNQD